MTWAWSTSLTNSQKLDLILAAVRTVRDDVRSIKQTETAQMATLADLLAAASAQTTVEASLESVLATVAADLKAALAAQDPSAIQAVLDVIEGNTAAMSAAIVENTPAAPTP